MNSIIWSRVAKSSTAEVDFLMVVEGEIHPMEVKRGAAGNYSAISNMNNTVKAIAKLNLTDLSR
jgi:hypothetical protein